MATANVSTGPKRRSMAAAGKPNPKTTAPAQPQTKPGGGKRNKGGTKKK